MLPKRHRLNRRSDVLRVRRLGKPYRHPLAILLVTEAKPKRLAAEDPYLEDVPPSRFAFAASSRVGSAVARNRAKRLLREALREKLPEVLSGRDCLFIVRETTPGADLPAVRSAVVKLLQRAELLVGPGPG